MVQTPTEVGKETSLGVKVYLTGLSVVGLIIVVLTYVLDWGTWGYGGGAFLLIAGLGSLVGNRFKLGWQPAIGPCPGCGARVHFTTKKQYLRCAHCELFLIVKGASLTAVGDPPISGTPEYPVPYVDGVTFPSVCMLCARPSTQSETIHYEKTVGTVGLPGVGPSLRTFVELQLQVPVCEKHVGHKAVAFGFADHSSTNEDGVSLKFRSIAALEAFRQHNTSTLPPIRNEPQR